MGGIPPSSFHTHTFNNMASPLAFTNVVMQAALEEREREVQSVWEQRKESLGELEKAKEELEEAKRKVERNRMTIEMMQEAQTGNQEKPEQDNLELFKALAEKLGETLESVGHLDFSSSNFIIFIIMSRCAV